MYDSALHLLSNTYTEFQLLVCSRVGNSVDPDQLAFQKPADLDLHCFQKD